MQKLFRQFTTIAKALTLVFVLFGGALFVSAQTFTWAPPTANAPQGNVAPPINVSTTSQTKGGILTFLGNSINSPTITAGLNSGSTARALFTAGIFDVGNVDIFGQLVVGSGVSPAFNAVNPATFWTPTIFKSKDLGTTPISIDLSSNNTANDPEGRNALNITGGGSIADNDSVGIIQNKPWFFFWDYGTQPNDLASIRAKHGNFSGDVTASNVTADANITAGGNADISGNIRIGGGNPGQDKILTSADGDGNGEWRNIGDLVKMSQFLDIKYVTHSWSNSGAGDWGDVSCPSGYVAISAQCDCQDRLDACLIAQLNNNNDAVSIPDNQELSINWGLAQPTPNWVTGNCAAISGAGDALHVQAVCIRFNDQGFNPQFVWKNIQAKTRKFCDNWGSYWTGVGKGCSVVWDAPAESPVVYIGGAGQSAKSWYEDKSDDGNAYAYGLMNANPASQLNSNRWGPTATDFLQPNSSIDYPYAAQYIPGTVSLSQLGNFNTGVRHSNLRDESTSAWDGEVAGCLYTDKAPGTNRPAGNRLNYNVDALSDIADSLYSGPCDENPDGNSPPHTVNYPGGNFPGTLYPVLTNDVWFLRPL